MAGRATEQTCALLRAEYAELLAHARAAVAAARLGQAAPWALLEGHLEERGQLPAPGARPEAEAARAYARAVDVYALAGEGLTEVLADVATAVESLVAALDERSRCAARAGATA